MKDNFSKFGFNADNSRQGKTMRLAFGKEINPTHTYTLRI
jgi:hypothetical protein